MAKRKKKRLRKWVKVTLAVLAVTAGGTVSVRMMNSSHASAVGAGVPEAATATASASAPAAEEISVDELDATPEPTAETTSAPLPFGNRGRLHIGDWSVALNGSDTGNNSDLQTYADAPDSAAYLEYKDKVMICDHASQGFSVIMSLQIGDKVTIETEDGTVTTLECTALYPDSYYKDGYVMMPDGTSAWDNPDGQYIMQTNQGADGNSLYLAMFNPVKDEAEATAETPDTAKPEETAKATASAKASASASAETDDEH